MGANSEHNEPFGALDTVRISLRVTQRVYINVVGFVNLRLRAVANKDWFTAPFDNGVLALRNVGHINLDLGQRKHIARRTHSGEEIGHSRASASSRNRTERTDHKVRKRSVSLWVLDTIVAKVGSL